MTHFFYPQNSAVRCRSICNHHSILLLLYCRIQAIINYSSRALLSVCRSADGDERREAI